MEVLHPKPFLALRRTCRWGMRVKPCTPTSCGAAAASGGARFGFATPHVHVGDGEFWAQSKQLQCDGEVRIGRIKGQ